ncbi:hypothetical protein CDAR_31701 [Caerostris darwini]|uniref:Uncharacterized protein n=1 Tax=Caerostris darwini TaxID=1538125 RepID=A0AAV4NRK4_9ARAC|nr:hypothetical protein CDAR_31701 [Caerostris darwini]
MKGFRVVFVQSTISSRGPFIMGYWTINHRQCAEGRALTLRKKKRTIAFLQMIQWPFRRVPTDAIAKWDGFCARFIFLCTLSRSLVK